MKIYGQTAYGLSQTLIGEVYKKTGIRATVGIGTNMFLAKIALDITAKHAEDFTGYLDENLFKKTIWKHRYKYPKSSSSIVLIVERKYRWYQTSVCFAAKVLQTLQNQQTTLRQTTTKSKTVPIVAHRFRC